MSAISVISFLCYFAQNSTGSISADESSANGAGQATENVHGFQSPVLVGLLGLYTASMLCSFFCNLLADIPPLFPPLSASLFPSSLSKQAEKKPFRHLALIPRPQMDAGR